MGAETPIGVSWRRYELAAIGLGCGIWCRDCNEHIDAVWAMSKTEPGVVRMNVVLDVVADHERRVHRRSGAAAVPPAAGATTPSPTAAEQAVANVRAWAEIAAVQRVHPNSSPTSTLQAAGRHALSLLPPDTTAAPNRLSSGDHPARPASGPVSACSPS